MCSFEGLLKTFRINLFLKDRDLIDVRERCIARSVKAINDITVVSIA